MEVGRCCTRVKLLEESAGGFTVLVEDSVEIGINQTAVLRTASGHFEVRIAHISSPGAAETEDQTAPAAVRVGLERLRELDWETRQGGFRQWLAGIRRPFHSGEAPLGRFILPGIAVVVFAAGVAWVLSRPGNPLSDWVTGRVAQIPAFNLPWSTSEADQAVSGASSGKARKAVCGAAEKAPRERAGGPTPEDPLAEVREAVANAPGPEVFLLPTVIRYLELSPAQQQQMAEIIATAAARRPDAAPEDAGGPQTAVPASQAARDRASHVLTPAQQRRWRRICPP